MAQLSIRIDIAEGQAFGPGKADLLELLDKKGSIRAAAAAMAMSYRRAWLLLHDIEQVMGAPVIETSTGGTHGGGARLTPLGKSVLAHYRTIQKLAAKSASTELRALTRLAHKGRT